LHIGNPKAGSTSLQDFLFHNREKLLGHGILFPVVEGENSQSHSALPKSISGMAPGPNRGKLTFAKLEEMIAGSSAHTIVVSSEFFVQAHRYPEIAERVRDLARRLDLGLTVVACVRPQHLWINSSYTQATKSLKNALPFAAYCERNLQLSLYNP